MASYSRVKPIDTSNIRTYRRYRSAYGYRYVRQPTTEEQKQAVVKKASEEFAKSQAESTTTPLESENVTKTQTATTEVNLGGALREGQNVTVEGTRYTVGGERVLKPATETKYLPYVDEKGRALGYDVPITPTRQSEFDIIIKKGVEGQFYAENAIKSAESIRENNVLRGDDFELINANFALTTSQAIEAGGRAGAAISLGTEASYDFVKALVRGDTPTRDKEFRKTIGQQRTFLTPDFQEVKRNPLNLAPIVADTAFKIGAVSIISKAGAPVRKTSSKVNLRGTFKIKSSGSKGQVDTIQFGVREVKVDPPATGFRIPKSFGGTGSDPLVYKSTITQRTFSQSTVINGKAATTNKVFESGFTPKGKPIYENQLVQTSTTQSTPTFYRTTGTNINPYTGQQESFKIFGTSEVKIEGGLVSKSQTGVNIKDITFSKGGFKELNAIFKQGTRESSGVLANKGVNLGVLGKKGSFSSGLGTSKTNVFSPSFYNTPAIPNFVPQTSSPIIGSRAGVVAFPGQFTVEERISRPDISVAEATTINSNLSLRGVIPKQEPEQRILVPTIQSITQDLDQDKRTTPGTTTITITQPGSTPSVPPPTATPGVPSLPTGIVPPPIIPGFDFGGGFTGTKQLFKKETKKKKLGTPPTLIGKFYDIGKITKKGKLYTGLEIRR